MRVIVMMVWLWYLAHPPTGVTALLGEKRSLTHCAFRIQKSFEIQKNIFVGL